MANRSGVSSQNISRTDILAEGPVRGLKNGSSSIFFNDVAAEDAVVRGYNPVEGTTSGKITFNGTSLTNTSVTGATFPLNLVNPTGVPRQLVLKNYRSTNVTVAIASSVAVSTVVTCTATSGTPFTTDWNTQQDYKSTAYLKADGVLIKGQFSQTSSSVGSFVFNGLSDTIDTTETYELRIAVGFYIDTINSSTSLTLKSSYSGYSGATPAAGTYFFEVPPLVSSPRDRNNLGFSNKIEGIEVEFRPGHRYQDPLNEIGGVGGSIAATTSVNHELKVIGTGEIAGISPVPEDGSIGSTMESGLPLDSQDDVASDATVLNDTAFGITAAQRPEVDEISLRITYPGGLQYINSEKGKRSTSYARYLIQIQTTLDNVDSEWENAFPGSYVGHQGRTNAAYSFDHVLGLNQYRPFDSFKIRVIRLTRHIGLRVESSGHGNGVTNREKWTLIAKSKIDQLGYVIKDRLSYPYTSLISTSFSSKQYQEPPKMSYLMQGLKVKVPNSYTPREYSPNGVAQYEAFWNGNFKDELQYTDNPAWVFYDIVTNNRYGAGRWIKESDVDKYALYNIAKYCDELVDDGAGGTEPRFRSNIFLTKATDVYKVLKDFASSFTAMVYWLDGQVTAVQDVSKDPIYTFSKSNVIDGKFGYESSGLKTRSNQIVVTWNDPKSNYEPVPLIVEDREAIVRDKRLIPQEVVAFGCTSEAQAIRYGRWKLWTAQKQTEIVSFKSALNSLYIKPGDIINVQDADRQGAVYSGRVSSATTASVTLDRSVTLNSGSTYTLSTLVISNGEYSIEENEVTNSSGSTSILTVASFTNTPSTSTIWALKETKEGLTVSGSYKEYKVLSITQDKSNEYSFSAVEHYDEKYTYIDSGYVLAELDETIYEETEPRDGETEMPAPSNLRLVLETDATRPGEEFKLEWDPSTSDFVDLYEIFHNIEDTENPLRTSGTFTRFTNVPNGSIDFSVRAVSTGGNYSRFINLNYVSTDPYGTNIARVQYGIPRGIRSTSESGIVFRTEDNPDGVTQTDSEGNVSVIQIERPYYVFLQDNAVISSNGNLDEFVNLTENAQDISEMINNEDHYVFKTGTTLSLYYYDEYAIENIAFWRDVGAGFRARIFGAQTSIANPATANNVMTSAWTSIGSCTLSGNVLTGSNFTSSLQLRDILSLTGGNVPGKITSMGSFVVGKEYIITSVENSDFTSIGAESNTAGLSFIATGSGTGGGLGTAKKVDQGAIVVSIVDANTAILDRSLDLGTSSLAVYRASYRPDYENDAAIARVKRTGGESDFEYSNFVQIDPNLGTPKSILVNVDPNFLTYDIQGQQTNAPSSIDAEVYALGFEEPEFKMELLNRTDPVADNELDGTEVDFISGETDNLFRKDFTLDTTGTVEYAATDLSARFTIREKNNTDLTVVRTVSIPRRRDAASVFLELDNDNVTVFADTTDEAATVNFNCTATVSRGNNQFDIIAPDNVFVITASATSDITGSLTGATYRVTELGQNFTSGSVTFTATGVVGTEFDGVTLTKVMSISISSTSGIDAEVYQINSSVGAISYNPNTTTFVPPTSTGITFSSQKFVGDNLPISYSGYWRIYLNGSSTASYSSSSAESSVNFTSYTATDTLITAKLYLENAASTLLDSETLPIVSSGTSGEDAKFLRLKTDHQVFVKAKDGTIAPSTIEFTAEKVNLASDTNVTWSSAADLYANPTDTSPITQSSFTGTTVYLKSSSVSSTTTSVSVTAQAIENSVTYTDTESIERVDEGSDTITVSLSNDNVTLTASNSGVVPNDAYTGSGTEIIVREGSNVLDYDASGSTAGHWRVQSITVSPSSAITAGTASASSGTDDRYAIISDASSMSNSSDEATITFTITGKKLDGTSFSETKVQTFSKAKAGDAGQDTKFLRLKTDHQVFVKRKNGTIEPNAIKFTAEKSNITGTVNWTTSPSTTLYTAASGGSATTTGDVVYLRKGSASSNTSISVTATLSDNNVIYTDTESIERVDDGSDTITVSLSNDNVSLTANNDGTVPSSSFSGSGTNIIVREGSDVLDYDGTGTTAGHWTVSTVISPSSALTIGSISTSSGSDDRYAILSDATAMSSSVDEATITFTITGKKLDGTSFSETKVQTFSKSQAGEDSIFLRLKTDHQVFVKRKNGTIEPDAITFTAEKINLSGTVNWTTSPSTTLYTAASGGSATTTGDVVYLRKSSVSSNTSISVTATVTNSDGTFFDTETVERVDEGSDAITVALSNNNVTFTADSSGTVPGGAYIGSGTTITVREGSNVLDYDASGATAGHWTVATPTVNPTGGITVGSISQSGDLAVVADASNMSSSVDNVAVTYTVSGKKLDGTSFSEDKVQTFSKSEAGDTGGPGDPAIQVSATNLTHTFIAGTNGIVSNNNFSCSFNLSQGGTAFTYAGSGTTANTFGITISSATNCSVTNTSGSLTIDATSNILDTASVTNASFVVTLFDRGNSNATIASYTINLSKINQALRDGGTFTFTGYDGTYAAAWGGTLTTAAAQAVAQSVINNSSDGFITPNDKITVSGTLSGVTYAATRVYTGTRTNASSSVGTSSFSSVVTEIFDGSVIVNGTLSAETLTADTTITNNIRVGERLQIGSPNDDSSYDDAVAASGIIHSVRKSTFTDTDPGFYLDGSGNVLIGNSTNFFKFDASEGDFTLSGNVTIQGPGGLSATLTRENAQAPSDSDGSNPVLTNTATTFKVFVGNTEVSLQKDTDSNPTADFLISRSKSPNNNNWQYSISSDGATITPTTLTVDEATVTFTATPRSGGDYADYPSISKTYTITKVPEGAAIKGDPGESLDIIFKRSSSQPTTPSPLPSTPSGWVTNVSSTTGTNLLWASVGTKASGATNYTWQTPYQVEGTAVAEVAAYRLNNSTRSDTGSYNFTTSTLTPPTDWSVGPPSITTDGDIVYVIVGTASGSPTATAASITWSSAAVYARQNKGDPGDPGVAFFNLDINTTTAASASSLITNTRVLAAIGRYAIVGDIVVVSTNNTTTPSYGWKCTSAQSASSDGSWTAAATFISGDLIVDGSIGASEIAANAIGANQLEISNTSAGSEGIFIGFDSSNNPKIEIRDNNALRVKIGYLG